MFTLGRVGVAIQYICCLPSNYLLIIFLKLHLLRKIRLISYYTTIIAGYSRWVLIWRLESHRQTSSYFYIYFPLDTNYVHDKLILMSIMKQGIVAWTWINHFAFILWHKIMLWAVYNCFMLIDIIALNARLFGSKCIW